MISGVLCAFAFCSTSSTSLVSSRCQMAAATDGTYVYFAGGFACNQSAIGSISSLVEVFEFVPSGPTLFAVSILNLSVARY